MLKVRSAVYSGRSNFDDILDGERVVFGKLRIRPGRHRHRPNGWKHVLSSGFVGNPRKPFDDLIPGRLEELDDRDPREPAQVSAIQEALIFGSEGAAVEPGLDAPMLRIGNAGDDSSVCLQVA